MPDLNLIALGCRHHGRTVSSSGKDVERPLQLGVRQSRCSYCVPYKLTQTLNVLHCSFQAVRKTVALQLLCAVYTMWAAQNLFCACLQLNAAPFRLCNGSHTAAAVCLYRSDERNSVHERHTNTTRCIYVLLLSGARGRHNAGTVPT